MLGHGVRLLGPSEYIVHAKLDEDDEVPGGGMKRFLVGTTN